MVNHAHHTYIIAEAGVNHNGDEKKAYQLIDIAVSAGADAVKFQMFNPTELVTATAPTASYQAKNLKNNEISQRDMLESLTLPNDAYVRLAEYCNKQAIDFLCTPFDHKSLQYLISHTDMRYLKLPSGEVTNAPLLLAAARTRIPIILSTGMSNMDEIGTALSVLFYGYTGERVPAITGKMPLPTPPMLESLQNRVILLHCVSQYPAPAEATNLRAMESMRQAFGLSVGLSDHTLGTSIPIAATALGATVIEKHFTYDTNAPGPDHKASLSPDELTRMIKEIHQVESAMGDGVKECQLIEENTRMVARKSLVAAKKIHKNELFTDENLTCKRPATGALLPLDMWQLLGKSAKRDYAADDFIAADELTQ